MEKIYFSVPRLLISGETNFLDSNSFIPIFRNFYEIFSEFNYESFDILGYLSFRPIIVKINLENSSSFLRILTNCYEL